MTERVPSDQIEAIVGVPRDEDDHYARAISAKQTVYILHSRHCLNAGYDLRDCPYSLALDWGIDVTQWVQDAPVIVAIKGGRLVPSQ